MKGILADINIQGHVDPLVGLMQGEPKAGRPTSAPSLGPCTPKAARLSSTPSVGVN